MIKTDTFQIGDWVEVASGRTRGYLINVDPFEERAYIQITKNDFNKYKARTWISFSIITKLQQETDPNILIDLALATRDEEWFTQLTRGME